MVNFILRYLNYSRWEQRELVDVLRILGYITETLRKSKNPIDVVLHKR